jgi:hypothetical protein
MWYGTNELCLLSTSKPGLNKPKNTPFPDTKEPRQGIDRKDLRNIISIPNGDERSSQETHVEDDECAEDTEVPPVVGVPDVEVAAKELVRGPG